MTFRERHTTRCVAINDEIVRRAEELVDKYLSDQKRYPGAAGVEFIKTSQEYKNFMDAVCSVNPVLDAHRPDPDFYPALNRIIKYAARGKRVNMPDIFQRVTHYRI